MDGRKYSPAGEERWRELYDSSWRSQCQISNHRDTIEIRLIRLNTVPLSYSYSNYTVTVIVTVLYSCSNWDVAQMGYRALEMSRN